MEPALPYAQIITFIGLSIWRWRVALEAKRQNFKRVGILGTSFLMESDVLEKLGKHKIESEIPVGDERRKINEIIFNELVYGVFKPESRDFLTG